MFILHLPIQCSYTTIKAVARICVFTPTLACTVCLCPWGPPALHYHSDRSDDRAWLRLCHPWSNLSGLSIRPLSPSCTDPHFNTPPTVLCGSTPPVHALPLLIISSLQQTACIYMSVQAWPRPSRLAVVVVKPKPDDMSIHDCMAPRLLWKTDPGLPFFWTRIIQSRLHPTKPSLSGLVDCHK